MTSHHRGVGVVVAVVVVAVEGEEDGEKSRLGMRRATMTIHHQTEVTVVRAHHMGADTVIGTSRVGQAVVDTERHRPHQCTALVAMDRRRRQRPSSNGGWLRSARGTLSLLMPSAPS